MLPNIEEIHILQIIECAVTALKTCDRYLLDKEVKEECINHKIANHLYTAMMMNENEHFYEIVNLIKSGKMSIDLEYDKHKEARKEMPGGLMVRPDIVVHERGSDNYNFMFIEVKKSYSSKLDIEKCKKAKMEPFNYQHSICIDKLVKQAHRIRPMK